MNKIYFHADDFGRSRQISSNIINCIKKGNINSVSVMVSYLPNIYHTKLKNIKNVNIKLHLNLTELHHKKSKILSNLNFFKLIFLKERNKKIIFKEIELQIKKFISLYKIKSLQIDGHEHIQMIPWIFNYIKNLKKKYKITEIRISNEKLLMPRINDFCQVDYFRNIIACLTLKFFNLFLDQSLLVKKKFIGVIYTGNQTENTIFKTINFYKNTKNTAIELLVHPGFTDKKERILFKKKYFKFYSNSNRKQEYELCFSNKIKIFLKKINGNQIL